MSAPLIRPSVIDAHASPPGLPLAALPLTACGPGPWLVMAPHDDDAVLGMGGLIAAAAEAGIAVHIAVVTDGRMGWNHPRDKDKLVAIRAAETEKSCAVVGVPSARLHRLGFPDGSLHRHQGCRAEPDDQGVGRAMVALMRNVRPGAVFSCTQTDLHPDHRITASETAMAVAWASGSIWQELGEPIASPKMWNYAVYCDFATAPRLQVHFTAEHLTKKIDALKCFVSQPFISDMLDRLRHDGPIEYLEDATWKPYRPAMHAAHFPTLTPTSDAAILHDAQAVITGLSAWTPWSALEKACAQPQGLRLIGEGSSRLFVAGFARHVARHCGQPLALDAMGGRCAQQSPASSVSTAATLVVSNSGATREVVEWTTAQTQKPLALLGIAGGQLDKLTLEKRIVLAKPETAVAATASVFLQAFTVGAAVAASRGQDVPVAALQTAVADILATPIPAAWRTKMSGATRLWWCDNECGLADELALKTAELCGILGQSAPGTMALHGLEEVFTSTDRVLWLQADPRDATLTNKVQSTTATPQIDVATVFPLSSSYSALSPMWQPLLQLVVGWRLLADLAVSMGRDPAKPNRARKVGNPSVSE